MKRKIFLSFVIVSLGVWVALPTYGQLYTDRIAAVVNGDVILSSDVKKHKQPIIRNITSLPLGIVPPGKWPTEKEILDELIVMHLLEQEADRKGIKVNEKGIDASIASIRKRNNLSHDQFILFLAANGVNYSDYRRMMKRHFRLRKLIGSEVTLKVTLSEADAQKYFKKNQGKIDEQFQTLVQSLRPPAPPKHQAKPDIPTHQELLVGGRVRLRQITLKIPAGASRKRRAAIAAKANRIYSETLTGGDFSRLAKRYSQDPLAENGGDLGFMRYRDLRPSVQKIVQRMKVGDITPPLKTPSAIFIFYLAEAKGRKVKRVRIPERVRKQLEKKWKETYEKQVAQRRKETGNRAGAKRQLPNSNETVSNQPNSKKNPGKNLGILTPAEEKAYEKVRAKVYAILKTKRSRARMKEWIKELKKNSIIEVKI
jgi:peptidyl-prolyl cis-trans isomerase SurA